MDSSHLPLLRLESINGRRKEKGFIKDEAEETGTLKVLTSYG